MAQQAHDYARGDMDIKAHQASFHAFILLSKWGSLTVGTALSFFTGRAWLWSAVRQLLISAAAAGVTYSIGHLIGSG